MCSTARSITINPVADHQSHSRCFSRSHLLERLGHRPPGTENGDRHLLLPQSACARHSQTPHSGVIQIPELLHIILIVEWGEGIGQNSK